jgi:hypothetical protein
MNHVHPIDALETEYQHFQKLEQTKNDSYARYTFPDHDHRKSERITKHFREEQRCGMKQTENHWKFHHVRAVTPYIPN